MMSYDNPKFYGIGAILYIFFMLVLWKFQIGDAAGLTGIKIVISIVFLPVCFGLVYMLGED